MKPPMFWHFVKILMSSLIWRRISYLICTEKLFTRAMSSSRIFVLFKYFWSFRDHFNTFHDKNWNHQQHISVQLHINESTRHSSVHYSRHRILIVKLNFKFNIPVDFKTFYSLMSHAISWLLPCMLSYHKPIDASLYKIISYMM